VAPGTYTVKLAAGSKELSRKLTLRKDPSSAATEADIQAQVEMLRELWDLCDAVAIRVNQIESIRKQIDDLEDRLEDRETASSVIAAAKELDDKLIALEGDLIDLKYTAGQDSLRWPARFYSKVGSLAGEVGSTDFPPTAQQIEVHEMYKSQWTAYQSELDDLLERDLAGFNNLLVEHEFPHIVTR
jgi:hypothetical protein